VTSVFLAPSRELSVSNISRSSISDALSCTGYRVSILCIEFSVFGNLNRPVPNAFSVGLLLYRAPRFLVKKADYNSDRWEA